jgi:hypothetical protein
VCSGGVGLLGFWD